MLQVRHLTLRHTRDLRILLQNLSFTLSGVERLAVIGEEGNGKSTLLKAIARPHEIENYTETEGEISLPQERIGYLPQEVPHSWLKQTVFDVVSSETGLLEQAPAETAQICRMLQMNPELLWSPNAVKTLSGGEKVKLMLFVMLSLRPTLLILDEPGNDLDIPALKMLENFLLTCNLPVLYISHDETLLQKTATRILHLEQIYKKSEPRWTLANVPYAVYMEDRTRMLEKQETLYQEEKRADQIRTEKLIRIENAVEHAQKTISRADPHGGRLLKKKMKAVKSMEKRFERERENMTTRPNVEYAMNFTFSGHHTLPAGKTALDFYLDVLRTEDRVLAENIRLYINGGEKVLLMGENGCGKTTLLHCVHALLRERKDIRAMLVPQRYDDVCDETTTAVQYLAGDGDKEKLTKVRTTLGAMKFTREEMEHPFHALSGGQKAKVLLFKAEIEDANVLLLDEPTRNLSPLSAPVFRTQLLEFPGSILCISHDRTLMKMWPGDILRMTRQGLTQAKEEDWA